MQNQEDFEKSLSFIKKYFYEINFNILFSNFEALINEYRDSDNISLQINSMMDKYFELKKDDEEVKLEFNLKCFSNINIDQLIDQYNLESLPKKDLNQKENSHLSMSSFYNRTLLFFIIFKYYKQLGRDFDKVTEEKINRFLTNILIEKEINFFQFYKLMAKKILKRIADENINMNNIQINTINEDLGNNLNLEKTSILNQNSSINQNNTNSNNYIANSLILNNYKEDFQSFFAKFLAKLSSKNTKIESKFQELINLNEVNVIKDLQSDNKKYIDGSKCLMEYYSNELIFIHFNEFLILSAKQDFNDDIYLSVVHFKIILGYFVWKHYAKVFFSLFI